MSNKKQYEIILSIKSLRGDSISLEDIEKELSYREKAGGDARWDSNLIDYTTEELSDIEAIWRNVA